MGYSPSIGRFIERDPIGYSEDGMNLYEFVRSNPETRTDPQGTASMGVAPGRRPAPTSQPSNPDAAAKNGTATCGEWAFSSGQDPMPSWISTAINMGLISKEDAAKGRYLNPDMKVGGEHPIYAAAQLQALGITSRDDNGHFRINPSKMSGITPLGNTADAIDKPCPEGHYKVILYLYSNPAAGAQGIDPAKGDLMANDWHWATQHSDGSFSDKSTSRKACACSPRPSNLNPFMKIVGVFCVAGNPRTAPDKLP